MPVSVLWVCFLFMDHLCTQNLSSFLCRSSLCGASTVLRSETLPESLHAKRTQKKPQLASIKTNHKNKYFKGTVYSKILICWNLLTLRSSKMSLFFIWTYLKKCSITSLARQLILCSEWLWSEWVLKQMRKTLKYSTKLKSFTQRLEKLHVCNKSVKAF